MHRRNADEADELRVVHSEQSAVGRRSVRGDGGRVQRDERKAADHADVGRVFRVDDDESRTDRHHGAACDNDDY